KEAGWPALAHDKTRFVGEPVAAVVATDRDRAEDALEAIQARYEPLPAVADAETAMRPDAPRLHEHLADNVLMYASYEKGGVDAALAAAEVRLSETFRHARCSSAPMEGRGIMAAFDAVDGTLTVWAATQAPHMFRTGLATALGMPDSRVRVLCPAVGGG